MQNQNLLRWSLKRVCADVAKSELLLEFTPLEFETLTVPLQNIQELAKLEFTPLEFET